MSNIKRGLEAVLKSEIDLHEKPIIQNENYYDNLIVKKDFQIDNEQAQLYAFQVSQNIKQSLTSDFNLLVSLYKLKTCFSTAIYSETDEEKIIGYILNESRTYSVEIKGKKQNLTYYKLCKELFNLAEGTVQNYNTFSAKYINNINVPDVGNEFNECTYIYPIFKEMSISKLLALNPLLVWQVDKLVKNGVLTPNLTVKQITAIVKRVKELGVSGDYNPEYFILEEHSKDKIEIEKPAFDMDREERYELFDFKAYGKEDLLQIAFDCYNAYRAFKKKLEELKAKNKKKEVM